MNEGLLRRGRAAFKLLHPRASSVLYLSGAGGPTLVLAQTPQGSCGPPQEGAPGCGGPAQRHSSTQLWAPVADAAARHLAPCGWLLRPHPGRFALWRGNLAHCVLPGETTAAVEAAGAAEAAGVGVQPPPSCPAREPAAVATAAPDSSAGGSPPQVERVTLILAWWSGDPRAELGAGGGESGGSGSDSGGSGADPQAGGSGGQRLHALMQLPSVGPHAPGWLQDMTLREGEWRAYQEQAGAACPLPGGVAPVAVDAAADSGGAAGGAWRPADECVSPCWVEVADPPGSKAASGPGAVPDAALLPPLRYFLPAADAIAAAYGQA